MVSSSGRLGLLKNGKFTMPVSSSYHRKETAVQREMGEGLGDEVRGVLWYDSAKTERRRRMEFSEKLQILRKQKGWT